MAATDPDVPDVGLNTGPPVALVLVTAGTEARVGLGVGGRVGLGVGIRIGAMPDELVPEVALLLAPVVPDEGAASPSPLVPVLVPKVPDEAKGADGPPSVPLDGPPVLGWGLNRSGMVIQLGSPFGYNQLCST